MSRSVSASFVKTPVAAGGASGWSEESSLEEFGLQQPAGFLGKPYGAQDLLLKLAEVLAASPGAD